MTDDAPSGVEHIYQPPNAALQDPESDSVFFTTSIRKLVILFVATHGLYAVYWFYKQWATIRESLSQNVWPIPRAIFYVFFTHSLFREFASHEVGDGNTAPEALRNQAWLLVLFALVSYGCDRAVQGTEDYGIIDLVGYLTLLGVVVPLVNAQRVANAKSRDPNGQTNARFTLWNWLFVVIGGFIWAAIIFSVVMELREILL